MKMMMTRTRMWLGRITPPKWKPCKARKKLEHCTQKPLEHLAIGSSKMHGQTGLSKLRPFWGVLKCEESPHSRKEHIPFLCPLTVTWSPPGPSSSPRCDTRCLQHLLGHGFQQCKSSSPLPATCHGTHRLRGPVRVLMDAPQSPSFLWDQIGSGQRLESRPHMCF